MYNNNLYNSRFPLSSYIAPESLVSSFYNSDLARPLFGYNSYSPYFNNYQSSLRLPYGTNFDDNLPLSCRDSHIQGCQNWAQLGYCITESEFMTAYCRASCRVCQQNEYGLNNYNSYGNTNELSINGLGARNGITTNNFDTLNGINPNTFSTNNLNELNSNFNNLDTLSNLNRFNGLGLNGLNGIGLNEPNELKNINSFDANILNRQGFNELGIDGLNNFGLSPSLNEFSLNSPFTKDFRRLSSFNNNSLNLPLGRNSSLLSLEELLSPTRSTLNGFSNKQNANNPFFDTTLNSSLQASDLKNLMKELNPSNLQTGKSA